MQEYIYIYICAVFCCNQTAPPPDGFYPYVPEELPLLHRGVDGYHTAKEEASSDVRTTATKGAELKLRIRSKEELKAKSTKYVHCRLRVKSSPGCLIKTVVDLTDGAAASHGNNAEAAELVPDTAAWARLENGRKRNDHRDGTVHINDQAVLAQTEGAPGDASGSVSDAPHKKHRVNAPREYCYSISGLVVDQGDGGHEETSSSSKVKKARMTSPVPRAYSG